jgi:hypothetical protein
LRIKTVWFKQEGIVRPPEEVASVLAATIWKLADKTVTGLSKADYDIVTPERGFRIVGEVIAFQVHLADRLLHGRVDDARRAAMIQALGKRLAEVMEENIRAVVVDDGFDYQSNFIDMLNRRSEDYATFSFPQGDPDFPALRYLGNMIRDVMMESDRPWVIDQIMSIETPEIVETMKRAVNGLLDPAPPKRRSSAAGD